MHSELYCSAVSVVRSPWGGRRAITLPVSPINPAPGQGIRVYVAQRHLDCALRFCTVMGDYAALWPKPRTSSDGAQLTPQSCTVE